MSELYEFSAEEMKGCPPFYIAGGNFFISCYGDQIEVQIPCSGNSGFEPRFVTHVKCNPHDRMMAICKHLFELMPKATIIKRFKDIQNNQYYIQVIDMNGGKGGQWFRSDLNPFIGTERTEVTREEVMND